jgi:hypothetical protein
MQISPALVAAKEAAEPFILSLPGVLGMGIGMREDEDGQLFDEVAIRIFVDPDALVPFGLPQEVGGVAVSIIRTRIAPCAIPDESRYNELGGGMMINSPLKGNGTLAAIVKYTEPATGASQLVGLSCFHVTGPVNVAFPDTIWQATHPPFAMGGGPVQHTDNLGAVLKVDFPDMPDLLSLTGETYGWTDSAIFKLDDALSHGRTTSKKILGHNGPPLMVNAITATAMPTTDPPQDVRKRGFVTGLTKGRIIGAYTTVPWTPGGPKAKLKQQFEIEGSASNPGDKFCDEGDSGSLVVAANSATALGLLWGRRLNDPNRVNGKIGVMSPITTVETRLGAKVAWT